MSPSGGRRHRFPLLVFRGEYACKKLSDICGALFPENQSIQSITGETIRDTYADLILDSGNREKVVYFEPAVLTPRKRELANESLILFSRHFRNDNIIIHNTHSPDPSKIEQTLVIIKPDNWKYASGKPGTIIDMFSRTGLRIVAMKILRFSLNQILDFYGPVEENLIGKLAPLYGRKAKNTLEREFFISLDSETERALGESFGREYARDQFRKIVEFMSGRRPDTCPPEEADKPGDVKCMVILYEGVDAVKKSGEVFDKV